MALIREPAVAGCFYPSDPDELRTTIRALLEEASPVPGPPPRALIAPHAGYEYSGAVAATAYTQLAPHRDTITRVILLGPAHRVPVRRLAIPGSELFRTPLGLVPVDPFIFRLLDDPGVTMNMAAHRSEHSLEVQLPFLQHVLDRFKVVPLLVGAPKPETVARVIETLWARPGTVVIVSADLSHYLDYASATRMDRRTCRAIEDLENEGIGHTQTCGSEAVRGLLVACRRRGLDVKTLDLRNSGDTKGPRDRVVGYGAWMFVEEDECRSAA